MAIATFSVVALDCSNAQEMVDFYKAITGWEQCPPEYEDDDWMELRNPTGASIAFQTIPDYRPPTWPGGDTPQQLHLDFDVPDLDTAEAEILAIGAVKAEIQPHPENFRVYLDPAGHPFCLVRSDSETAQSTQ